MASKYYILNSDQYNEHSNNLEYTPMWNVNESACVVEVNPSYVINNYQVKFENNNDCQNWIYSPERIDEWYQPDESEIL